MNRLAAIDGSIRTVNNARLVSPAFTTKVSAGDNLMFHKAMDLTQPGDIVFFQQCFLVCDRLLYKKC
ncbi:hypothetical protein [Aeribacillus sp. FSL M8-0235]|uniref:hypothetical protein n=1 Tax=Aeribacillus sp. FSL M8-0235 TaxID=2954576 RepID=UPI00404733EF